MAVFSRRRTALIVAGATAGCLALAGQVHAAGLFDFLFGGAEPVRPAPTYVPSYEDYSPRPLEMRVRPRRERGEHARRERRESKPKLATPIDPKARPNWYLEDPTLRRGDIVVLKGKVLVFKGGQGGSLESFASLDQSSLSKTERTRISQMAGLQYVSAETAVAPEPAVRSRPGKRARLAKRSRSAKVAPVAPANATTMSFLD